MHKCVASQGGTNSAAADALLPSALQWIAFYGAVDILADQLRLTAAMHMLVLSCLAAGIVQVCGSISSFVLTGQCLQWSRCQTCPTVLDALPRAPDRGDALLRFEQCYNSQCVRVDCPHVCLMLRCTYRQVGQAAPPLAAAHGAALIVVFGLLLPAVAIVCLEWRARQRFLGALVA